MIQTVTSLFFLETNLSLTFQGDFCVSMIRKRRSPLQNAESRDVLREQLKRRPVPRSGTRNGPREKENEHTPTVNVEPPKCHCLAVEPTRSKQHQEFCEKKIQNIVKRANTEQAMEHTASMTNDTHLRDGENVACVLRATQQLTFSGEGRPAQQPKRSSSRRPTQELPSHLEEQNHLPQKMHTQSCLASFFCNTQTCSNDDHAAPSPRSSPARAQRHRPTWGYWLRHKERRSETTTCLVSLLPLPRPAAMIAKLHRRSAAWWCPWKAQKNSSRAVPSG